MHHWGFTCQATPSCVNGEEALSSRSHDNSKSSEHKHTNTASIETTADENSLIKNRWHRNKSVSGIDTDRCFVSAALVDTPPAQHPVETLSEPVNTDFLFFFSFLFSCQIQTWNQNITDSSKWKKNKHQTTITEEMYKLKEQCESGFRITE